MAKIEIPLKKDYAGAFKYWVDTNTENGVCTIPEYICKGIVEMLGKQPDVPDTNVGDLISRRTAIDAAALSAAEWDGMYVQDINGRIRKALEQLPPAQPEQRWIPCCERLPENRVSVIVCFREWQQYAKRYVYSIVVGWYARKHSVRENVFSDWEADCEYDEIEDESYIEEGWYEFTTQGNGDLMNWYINADVIAWMKLPEPYKEGETT